MIDISRIRTNTDRFLNADGSTFVPFGNFSLSTIGHHNLYGGYLYVEPVVTDLEKLGAYLPIEQDGGLDDEDVPIGMVQVGITNEVLPKTVDDLAAELDQLRSRLVVTRRQFKLHLVALDKFNTIKDMYAALPDSAAKDATLIEWYDEPYIKREGPLVTDIQARLGFSDTQVDNFFTAAVLL